MIKFNKPTNLNGAELLDELAAVGIVLDKDLQSPFIDGNGDFWLDVAAKDKSKAEKVVAAHNGTLIVPDLSAQKQAILDRIGLTADELKMILG
jgi:hypothetical protein